MEIRLTGKRALVTGGGSGIGRAVALALGAAGARVAVNFIGEPGSAEEVVAQIHGDTREQTDGGEAIAVEADVTDAGQVERMFAQVDQAWGGLDILVNNAGIDGERRNSWEIEPEIWRRVLAVNLDGAFLCSRQALRRMVARRAGVILNITSIHEAVPWAGYAAYTVSKAGLSMLTRTLSMEAAPHGVRVLSLGPGAIRTPINAAAWQDRKKREALVANIPLGRLGEVDDIAGMAVVLVSDVAGFVTGTTVFVDGGMTDYPHLAEGD